jgi:hypothetical protein
MTAQILLRSRARVAALQVRADEDAKFALIVMDV